MERLTSVFFSKTNMELFYGGAVHCGLDSQHVQLLLQGSSAEKKHFSDEASRTYIERLLSNMASV